MKKYILIVTMLFTLVQCFGERINVYATNGKLKHSLKVGDFLHARVAYKSSYPTPPNFQDSSSTDLYIYGKITAISKSSVTVVMPSFYNYFYDPYDRNADVMLSLDKGEEVTLTPEEIKVLALRSDVESLSAAGVGFGIAGLILSPIVSLRFGNGAFRTERFVNWIAVSATVIVVGTIVQNLADPGIYMLQEINGIPRFTRYKQGTMRIE